MSLRTRHISVPYESGEKEGFSKHPRITHRPLHNSSVETVKVAATIWRAVEGEGAHPIAMICRRQRRIDMVICRGDRIERRTQETAQQVQRDQEGRRVETEEKRMMR